MTVSALDRKLLRDLWEMKGQAVAIALVVASGVAIFVMYHSNFDSLRRTQAAYYERQRFAEVFASLKRAPNRLDERIRDIPGVALVETRVVADVTLDVPDYPEPVQGRLVSIPATGRPSLNDLVLSRGRWIEPGRGDEVLVSEGFVLAHGLQPGDRLHALINGRRRALRIAGVALSPEYIYVLPPGELIPDDRRLGIIWMERRALGSAFDMEGGFNDVALSLMAGTDPAAVIHALDRLLAPYGGRGAIPRQLQVSHWTIDNELAQLQNFGVLVPAIFMGVATFLLNIAMTRALAIQRTQIAALKALGYRDREIGWHYVKWALVIAAAGGLLGMGVGAWLGSGLIAMYNQWFRFPVLLYRLSGNVALTGVLISLGAGALGAFFAVRRALAIPPAEAMRPEPPARYRPSVFERRALRHALSHATRMVLRNVERQPVRSLSTVVGIAFAVGILFFSFVFLDVMTLLGDIQFSLVSRQDVTVSFAEPASSRALFEMERLPGVLYAEPVRWVPARIRFEHRSRQIAVSGQPSWPELSRVVDISRRPVAIPPEGLLMSKMLGEILGVRVGDRVQLEVLEGERPSLEVPVAGLVDDYMGLTAWMEIGALRRLLREGGTLSGAHLMVDQAELPALYDRLKKTPRIAGVTITTAALESFRKVMAQNLETMNVFNVGFAVIIAFGVVYNAARISLSERSRELASLRVLGFTIGEISLILLGELALLTVLALPLGVGIGWALSKWALQAVQNELYRIPLIITPQAAAAAALTVVGASAASGLVVRRRLDRLDLVAVLKTRE
ncbi:MAG TPA: ABC transporter permease [Vicinamibacteria bacterium]|nr:ABC transporter permease [Vicinamibacteria bacterium]